MEKLKPLLHTNAKMTFSLLMTTKSALAPRSPLIVPFLVVVIIAGAQVAAAQERKPSKPGSTVLFVCEHGSAKSVIAAAHFNKLASDRHVKFRAVSRGTKPDEQIAPKAAEGLQADGLAVSRSKPRKLSRDDVARATRVITFCELPSGYSELSRVEQWNDVPPVSEDYNKARSAIVERIMRLLDDLSPPK